MFENISKFLKSELTGKMEKESEEMDKGESCENCENCEKNENSKDKKETYVPQWPKILGEKMSQDGSIPLRSIPLREKDEEMKKAA